MELLSKVIQNDFKEFSEKERTITHFISTPDVDAYNEVLEPDGMDDSVFKAVLWSHSLGNSFFDDRVPPPSDLVIGKSLWRKRSSDGVRAKTQFADTPLGNDVMNFNKEGLINSWSVGWLPKGDSEVKKIGGKTITVYPKWFLYEYSSVIIPANSGAVNLMLDATNSLQLKNILTYQKNYFSMEEQLKGYAGMTETIASLQAEIDQLKQTPAPDDIKTKALELENAELKEKLMVSLQRNAEYKRYFISGAHEPKQLSAVVINDAIMKSMSKLMGKKFKL